ncbi:MAG: alpha-2-macroglobulin family protein, partial [Desulfobacterales bacterium]
MLVFWPVSGVASTGTYLDMRRRMCLADELKSGAILWNHGLPRPQNQQTPEIRRRRPDFRAGRLNLTVKAATQQLNVELVGSPQRAGPGDEVTFSLKVSDSAGKPVRGEFSLALIDKAILALVEQGQIGIFETFYGIRPHQVRTALDLAVYAERVVAQELGRGGGGGGDVVSPAARSRFEDTAAWFGAIETNADGLASVTVTLPDNLTTWVANVRGLTAETLVGDA